MVETHAIPVYHTIAEVRAAVASARRAGQTIGCVPTMGALHAGHAELVRSAAAETSYVIVTVFVNPTQFGPNEDFDRYPRTLAADVECAASAGAACVFAPSVAEMYPRPFFSFVDVEQLGQELCGQSRPGHFRGVCTVVLKLLNICQPDVAIFGAKDAQQARILLAMVRDLNLPVTVKIAPTVREPDGLAMSSRNRYLSEQNRHNAPKIYQTLQLIHQMVACGETDVSAIVQRFRQEFQAMPDVRIDYVSCVDDRTLQVVETISGPTLFGVAIFFGATRLIDNIVLNVPIDRTSS